MRRRRGRGRGKEGERRARGGGGERGGEGGEEEEGDGRKASSSDFGPVLPTSLLDPQENFLIAAGEPGTGRQSWGKTPMPGEIGKTHTARVRGACARAPAPIREVARGGSGQRCRANVARRWKGEGPQAGARERSDSADSAARQGQGETPRGLTGEPATTQARRRILPRHTASSDRARRPRKRTMPKQWPHLPLGGRRKSAAPDPTWDPAWQKRSASPASPLKGSTHAHAHPGRRLGSVRHDRRCATRPLGRAERRPPAPPPPPAHAGSWPGRGTPGGRTSRGEWPG